MNSSPYLYSSCHFFRTGIYALMASVGISRYYDVIDLKELSEFPSKPSHPERKIVVFISNAVEYYAVKNYFKNNSKIIFIYRMASLSEILLCLLNSEIDDPYIHRIKNLLSDREQDILKCMLNNMKDRDIAGLFGIEVKTIYSHRCNLLKKIQVSNRISLRSVISCLKWYK